MAKANGDTQKTYTQGQLEAALEEERRAIGEVFRRDIEAIEMQLKETQSGIIGFPALEKHIRNLKQGRRPKGIGGKQGE